MRVYFYNSKDNEKLELFIERDTSKFSVCFFKEKMLKFKTLNLFLESSKEELKESIKTFNKIDRIRIINHLVCSLTEYYNTNT